MPKTNSNNQIKSLINKTVKVYSSDGLMREGVLKSANKDAVVLIGKNFKGRTNKKIVFNFDNIFMIEEQ